MRSWWKTQAKEAGDGGISDETLQTSRDAFASHADEGGSLRRNGLADLLRELDLLKYVPEDGASPPAKMSENCCLTASVLDLS